MPVPLPEWPTSRVLERRIRNDARQAPADNVTKLLLHRGYIAGGGQIVAAPPVPDPTRHIRHLEKNRIAPQAARGDSYLAGALWVTILPVRNGKTGKSSLSATGE